jgi:hypothetical protein
MNWEFIIQKVSETSWHIAIMISVVSLLVDLNIQVRNELLTAETTGLNAKHRKNH